jgi:RNA polymerase sigma-70 factor (ECF subfamily)
VSITNRDLSSSEWCPRGLRRLGDTELVAALCAGCEDALAILFERHSCLIFRIARAILRDDGEAEDTVQQVFLDVFRAITQFNPERGSFKTWLLQFAYHRSINRREHLRANQLYNSVDLDELMPSELLDGTRRLVQFPPQEIARLVEQVMAMLKPSQRTVFELTYFEGLTAEEIATKTGESVSVVRHSLYRGLSKLRVVLLGSGQARQETVGDGHAAAEGVFVAQPRAL